MSGLTSLRRSSRLRSKLAEQISELSNPKPASYHPDQEFLEDDTAAKVCEFTYEAEVSNDSPPSRSRMRSKARRKGIELEEQKYAGKVVSRKDLEAEIEGEFHMILFSSLDFTLSRL